jgi:tyrosinase
MSNVIAGMFSNETERHLYQQAASEIRFPYWDWSLPAPAGEAYFPEAFWHPTIRQYGPRGLQTIHNPLYSYSFHPVEEEAMMWSPVSTPSSPRVLDTNMR